MNRTVNRWVLALPVLLGALDLTVVTAVLPAVVAELAIPLPGGLRTASWMVTGYLVAYAAAVALGGVLTDRRGSRHAFLVATGVFVVGSLLVATATGEPTRWVLSLAFRLFEARPDPEMTALGVLIAARCLQAFGAGAVVPAAMAAVSSDSSRRLRDLGFIAGVDMAGWMLGHLYGGLLVQVVDWRVIFWVNIPLAAISYVVVRRGMRPEAARPGGGWPGSILGASGIALVALAAGGSFGLPVRVVLAVAGCAVAVSFAGRLVPVRVIVEGWRESVGNAFLGALIFFVLAAVPLYVSTLLEEDVDRAALITGILLSAFTIPMAGAAPLGGRVGTRWDERVLVGASSVLAFIGLALSRGWGDTEWSLVPGLVLAGVGFGGFLAITADRLIRRTPGERGKTSAGVIVLRLVGMALGTSLLTEWVLGRVRTLGGDLDAIRAGARDIFDEAFLIAIGMQVVLTVVMWSRGTGPSSMNPEQGYPFTEEGIPE